MHTEPASLALTDFGITIDWSGHLPEFPHRLMYRHACSIKMVLLGIGLMKGPL